MKGDRRKEKVILTRRETTGKILRTKNGSIKFNGKEKCRYLITFSGERRAEKGKRKQS